MLLLKYLYLWREPRRKTLAISILEHWGNEREAAKRKKGKHVGGFEK